MRKTFIAGALVASLGGWAGATQEERMVSERIDMPKGTELRIELNNGEIIVEAAAPGEGLSYRVGFRSDGQGWWPFRHEPAQRALDRSKVGFDRGRGLLSVKAGPGLSAFGRLAVPQGQDLHIRAANGILTIAARSGVTRAWLENGILNYDASALPAGACVRAEVASGMLTNSRSGACAKPGAVLAVENGVLYAR